MELDTLGQIKVSSLEGWPRQGVRIERLNIKEVSSFQGIVPLYTEVSSFQEVGIEEFHCIQRCPHFRRLE